MKVVIHGAPGSGSGIVEAACAEIGLDFEVRDLDARNDEHRSDAYAAINPHRKMPAIEVDDGEIITETVAILLTLDERCPAAGLLPPPGSKERAQALRWMAFLAAEMYPLVEMTDYPERFVDTDADAEALRGRAHEMLLERWRILEAAVSGSRYFLASGFSATDLYVTKFSVWLDEEWRRRNLPKVDALTRAVLERPALAGVWERHVR
jgi:glutathione S-transferase